MVVFRSGKRTPVFVVVIHPCHCVATPAGGNRRVATFDALCNLFDEWVVPLACVFDSDQRIFSGGATARPATHLVVVPPDWGEDAGVEGATAEWAAGHK
jgi:hypothetical protein